MKSIAKPFNVKLPDYYQRYLNAAEGNDLITSLVSNGAEAQHCFNSIPPGKENFRYASGKWTPKELISHIIDAERMFTYRALRFSRKDNTPIEGFDEDLYAPNSNSGERTMYELIEEFKAVRLASISLFTYMTDDMLDFEGLANNIPVTPRLIGWIIAGHCAHHCRVLREKYMQ